MNPNEIHSNYHKKANEVSRKVIYTNAGPYDFKKQCINDNIVVDSSLREESEGIVNEATQKIIDSKNKVKTVDILMRQFTKNVKNILKTHNNDIIQIRKELFVLYKYFCLIADSVNKYYNKELIIKEGLFLYMLPKFPIIALIIP